MQALAALLALVAADVCGPSGAETLARTPESRVYLSAGVAYGCHRDRSRPLRLGTRVIGATLAGRRAVIRRAYGAGEQLRMYDLRRGQAKEHAELAGTVATVRVDRTGLAVFVARLAGGLRVDAIRTGYSGHTSAAIEPASLRLAASTVAWREGETLHVRRLKDNRAPDTPLATLGDVQVIVRGDVLLARRGTRPARMLGETRTDCESSGGCSGIEQIQAAGRYVAALDEGWDRNSSSAALLVRNLDSGGQRRVCSSEPEGPIYDHHVPAFVLGASGSVACATLSGTLRRIRTADTVLDEGPGIDLGSLTRRGDRVAWLHDGVEHTAPLD